MSLNFDVTGDNSNFLRKLDEARNGIRSTSKQIEESGTSIEQMFGRMAKGAAAFGVGFSATQLIKDIVEVRGQFQQLEIAFETMLKSKEKASALMAQLTETAAKTPFDLQSVSQGAKQLLAYGTASEEVNDTLIRLGNIASGLSIPLGDLVYLYGTTQTQGRLFTQDVRQFMGRGIPLVKELAAELGKTEQQINEMVTAGKIGFPEVEKVIRNMTSENGQFYNLMEKQSASLTGQISNLGDAWDGMLNKIGTQTQGIASAGISAVTSLIDNYEEVGVVLASLVASYGTYKAAIIVVNTLEKANIMITRQAIIEKKLAAAANITLSNSMAISAARGKMFALVQRNIISSLKGIGSTLANPYVLLGAAVGAATYGLYKFYTRETEVEQMQRRYNDTKEAAAKREEEHKAKIDELISSIENEITAEMDRVGAMEMLKKLYPGIIEKYIDEEGHLRNIIALKRELAEFDAEKKVEQNKTELQSYDERIKNQEEYIDRMRTNDQSAFDDEVAKLNELKRQRELSRTNVASDYINKAINEAKSMSDADITNAINTYQKALADNKNGEWFDADKEFKVDEVNRYISALKNLQTTRATAVHDKEYWGNLKKETQSQLDALSDIEASGKKGLALKQKITGYENKINKAFSTNTSKQESASEKLRKEQEKLALLLDKQALDQARSSEDLQTQVDEARINAMDEGSKKTIAQMELNFEKEMQVIDRQKEDSLRKKIEGEKAKFDVKENENAAKDSKHVKQTFDPTGIVLSDDENKKYDDLYKAKIAEKEKEEKAYLDSLLEKHQDYTDQRLAIETKYNADIAALEEQRVKAVKNGDTNLVERIDRSKAQATKNKGKELMSMDYDKLKESPEYIRAFENLKRTSSETLNSLLSQLENAKQTAAQVLSPNELREYTTTIQEIMDELDSRNPFQALIDRKNELAEAENALAIASAQLEAVQKRGAKIETGAKNIRLNEKTGKIESEKTYLSATEALKKYNEAKDEAITANAKVEEAERKVDDVMGELFDSIKNVGSAIGGEAGDIIGIIADIGQFALMTMNSIDVVSKTTTTAIQAVEKASVILAIIGAAIQIATKIASLFNGTDYMEEFRKELSKLNYELELAKLNAEISTDEKSIFGDDLWGNAIKNVDLANDALSRYNDTLDQIANRKKYTGFIGAMADAKGLKNTYDSLGDSIANMQLKIRHKTFFRSAKYASLKDAVPELFNEDGSINQTALEEFIGSDTFEKLSQENQKYLQEMSDYWKAYQDSVEQVKDYLSDIFGDLGGTLTDTLVDAFANGTDAAQAFTDSVSEMLEQMGKQMIFHAVFSDIFKKAQQKMLDVTQNENLSDDDKFKEYVGILGGMTDEVMGEQDKFNALLEAYQKMAAEKGIDIFKPSDSSKESLDSFVSQMQSAFTSLDVTAKDVSDNIYDYFRQAMVNALYEKEYKSKMEELYKSFEDKSADGLSESDMAQLGTQVDQYINEMLKGVEGVNSLFADKLKDAADIQSFVDNVKSAMSSIEATAEDVTDNIFEYIRQQMVDKMFADTFQPQIEEFYKKVQAAMSDGSVTDSEKDALRKEAEKLANDITSAKDILSDTLGVTADNLKKEAEAEFKSFSDGILSSLYNAEVTAEAISKNIADSMRQELIKAMYMEEYEPRIRAIWDKWKEYSSDGLVTDEERASIKDDINDLSKEVADAAKDISDAWTEAGDAVYDTFESFSNSIKSVLQNAETTAEDVAKNIYQFMRNALVNSMFAEQVQPQIKAWYDKYAEYMKDGAIDTTERKTLDEMIAEIQKAGMEIVDAANGLFPSLDTGAIQEAENARNEAEQEWESFSDSMLSSLYDIEASAGDISDDMSEYMRKALIKAMYVNNYKPQMQKWYNEWQRAMGDDILTSEEKQTLDSMKQEMLDGMKKEAYAINQMFDSMYSQEASSKGFEGMSQDERKEMNGRFTALQIAGEEIKNQAIKQTDILSRIYEKMGSPVDGIDVEQFRLANVTSPSDNIKNSMLSMLSSMNLLSVSTNSNGITLTEIRNIMISSNGHLEDISKYTKTLLDVGSKLDSINKSIQKAL